MEMSNVGYEVTKGVGKVVQELQGILEMWSCWRQCRFLVHWIGDDSHWDGGGWVGRQGGVQGGKDGHQGGRQGGARVAGNIGAVIMLATMYVVGPLCRWWLSLRWWWMSRTIGRCTRWKRWSPRNGQRLIVLTLDFSSFRLQAWFL